MPSTRSIGWSGVITANHSIFIASQTTQKGLSAMSEYILYLMFFLTWKVLWAFITLVAIVGLLLLIVILLILSALDLLASIWTALLSIGANLFGIVPKTSFFGNLKSQISRITDQCGYILVEPVKRYSTGFTLKYPLMLPRRRVLSVVTKHGFRICSRMRLFGLNRME